MKILSDDHRVPTRRKTVELDPEEWNRPDADVLTAADNNGEFDRPAHHFGGHVSRRPDGKTVYVEICVEIYVD